MGKTSRVSKETEREARVHLVAEGTPPGTTTRISHDECGDTRNRLYITTHPSDGSAIMWCHNCSKWGRAQRLVGIPRAPKPKPLDESKLRIEDMNLVDLYDTKCPDPARHYVQHYLASAAITQSRIAWDTTTGRLAYPIFETASLTVDGYQLRSIDPEEKCKYLTLKMEQHLTLQNIISAGGIHRGSETLFITEDILSALCLRYDGKFWPDTLPLLGTYMHPSTATKILERSYEWIYVWLDNDVPEAIEGARKIATLLTMMGHKRVRTVSATYEPKKHPNLNAYVQNLYSVNERGPE